MLSVGGRRPARVVGAWQPTLTPGNVIATFFCLGVGCIVAGRGSRVLGTEYRKMTAKKYARNTRIREKERRGLLNL